MPDALRRLAAVAVLAAVLGIAWAGLYEGGRTGHLVLLAVAAALPALGELSPRARRGVSAAGGVVALVVVAAMATDVSVWSLVGLDPDAWSAVARMVPDGMAASSSTAVPASPTEDAAFVGLLDLAFAALTAGIAWQLMARRRPGAAVVLAGLGLAYRWTVEPIPDPVWVGTLTLAALIAALALGGHASAPSRRRGWGARAGAAGLAAVIGAALLAPGAATDERGWWDWRAWSLTGGPGPSSGLDIRQTYGQLDWPEQPRVVLRVRSERRLPLRAAVLSDFDGSAFTQALDGVSSRPLTVSGGRIFVDSVPSDRGGAITQTVRFEALRSTLVLAGGRPLNLNGRFDGIAEEREGGTVQVDPSLGPGTAYNAVVLVEDAGPAELIGRTTYSAEDALEVLGLTRIRPGFGAEAVDIPLWGTGGAAPPPEDLGDYAPLRDEALQVIGDTASPYVAVNRIESHLRQRFIYDEAPPFPEGRPPLVDFVFNTRRGFCQHFAGTMALMLRSVGIPTRVAVGYTPGRLDPERDEYTVLDRDAHSWVEVYLPETGWIDFDPTPGRAVANRASVSSPSYDPPAPADPAEPEVAPEPVAPVSDDPSAEPPAPRPAPEPAPAPGNEVAADTGGPGVDRWAVAGGVLLALLFAPGGWRAARRARLRRTGDERARVLGAVRDLEEALARSGFAPPDHADAAGRAGWLRGATGLDASALYAAAQAARYAPTPPRPGAARLAWSQARRLRRDVRRRNRWPRRLAAYLGVRPQERGTLPA